MSEAEALIEVPPAAAFPVIEPPPFDPDPAPLQPRAALTVAANLAPAKVTIQEAAVAHLRAREPEIAALAERYRAVAFDVSTTKGLGIAKAARFDLRENGRFAVQRARDATKDLLNGAKKDVEAEATRLIALVQPIEDGVDAQITVREEQLAREKAEAEAKERARVAAHEANINTIRSYTDKAVGRTSAQINSGIATLASMTFGPEWQEFAEKAEAAREVTVSLLLVMRDTAKAQEDEAARREAQRVEQERVAAEQKAEADRLAQVAAELKRQEEALQAERDRQDALNAELAAKEEAARLAALPPPAAPIIEERTESALAADARRVPETGAEAAQAPVIGDEGKAAHAEERAANPVATLNAGQIGARLGFVLTVAFIEETLGVQHAGVDPKRKNVLWNEAQWPDIKAALVAHVGRLP